MKITDEAVLIAYDEWQDADQPGTIWAARAALEAAVPHIIGDALRQAAEALLRGTDDLGYTGTDLSYRNCTSIDADYLRQRAKMIEEGKPVD